MIAAAVEPRLIIMFRFHSTAWCLPDHTVLIKPKKCSYNARLTEAKAMCGKPILKSTKSGASHTDKYKRTGLFSCGKGDTGEPSDHHQHPKVIKH